MSECNDLAGVNNASCHDRLTFLANSPAQAIMPAKTAIQNSQGCIPECVTLGSRSRLYRRSETHKRALASVAAVCGNVRRNAHFQSGSIGLTLSTSRFQQGIQSSQTQWRGADYHGGGHLRSCCRQHIQIQARSRALVGTRSIAPGGMCSWKHQQRCTSASPSPLAMMQALALPHSGHAPGSIASADMPRHRSTRAFAAIGHLSFHAASASWLERLRSKYAAVRRNCCCALSARLTTVRNA